MDVNNDAYLLDKRVDLESIASKLAPTLRQAPRHKSIRPSRFLPRTNISQIVTERPSVAQNHVSVTAAPFPKKPLEKFYPTSKPLIQKAFSTFQNFLERSISELAA